MGNIFQKKLNLDPDFIQIMDVVRRLGPIARTDIARVTGLSTPAVSQLVKRLLQVGFLQEDGFDVSTGGRRPVLLKISPEALFAVGVDIGAAKLRVAVTNLQTKIIKSKTQLTHPEEGKDKTIRKVIDTVKQLVGESGISWNKIQGIGVGISGVVNHQKGICLFWPNVEGWENVPLGKILEKEFQVPVLVDDSARTMALAEHWCGAARDVENFIFVNVGIGVGAAIFFHGQLYRGTSGTAGELGHTTVEENGPRCSCGNYGCLETLASGPAIARRAKKALEEGVISLIDKLSRGDPSKITPELVVEAARKGDKLAFNLMEKTGEYLGIAIANVLNLFNPELVIIGAGVSRAGDLILDPVKRTVKARALETTSSKAKIVISEMGDESGALGGAILILQKIFELPKWYKIKSKSKIIKEM